MSVDNVAQELNKYHLSTAKVAKSGYISRADKIESTYPIAKYIEEQCKERGILLHYDLSANGVPHELSISEVFAGNGGIMISPLDMDLGKEMFKGLKGNRDISFLKDNKDKYSQFESHTDSSHVIFMPGSNLYDHFPKELIRSHLEPDTVIKPHPITNTFLMALLCEEFTDRVMIPLSSAAPFLRTARKITVTEYTEIGLYARVRGKQVDVMQPQSPTFLPAYRHLYAAIDVLPDVLSTHLSGVFFFNENYKQEVDEYLDYYEKHRDMQANRGFGVKPNEPIEETGFDEWT